VRTITKTTTTPLNGYRPASQLELFPPETLMGVISATSRLTTSRATRNSIFLRVSEDGPSLFGEPVGPMTGQSGPAPAHASPGRLQGSDLEPPTSETSGQTSTGSFKPAGPMWSSESRSPLLTSSDLQSRLEDALKRRLAVLGSTLYSLTSSLHTTPAGRSLFLQRASGHHSRARGCTGWPTPRVGNNAGYGNASRSSQARIEDVAQTASGVMSSGSSAATDTGGLLNPGFTRWLQGFPLEWNDFGVTATQSAYPLQARLSRRISMRRLPGPWLRMKRWRESVARRDN
jgi:hypothetical protein